MAEPTGAESAESGDRLIECGKIGRAVGLKGEVAVFWTSHESPVGTGDELVVQLVNQPSQRKVKVAAQREQGRRFFLHFDGVHDCESAAAFCHARVFVSSRALSPLGEGEFYCYQIMGLDVVTEDGCVLGKVVNIFTAGENDVYEVHREGDPTANTRLIPAVAHVVLSIDLPSKRMTVRLMEGM